ncbi:DUF6233 domain-containing protein [Streptomyces albireticuli]|nr:DUF6233 domain-containing protein [Streptomyces albireticuli]MCD9194363.1 DUF6233 domain-containing protein [Streptomyces albireticuli]
MEQLFSHDELALITAAAEEAGMAPRDWVRGAVLQYLTEDLYEDEPAPTGAPYRPDLEHARWPTTEHCRSGRPLLELHHAGCWVPKGDEKTMTTAQARQALLAGEAGACDACLPERFLTPAV